MSERQRGLIHKSLIGVGALAIVLLLALFYSTVNGAVDRATQRRAEAVDDARLSAATSSTSSVPKFVSLTTASR